MLALIAPTPTTVATTPTTTATRFHVDATTRRQRQRIGQVGPRRGDPPPKSVAFGICPFPPRDL
eukprot:396667-Lingulodinium_polyedra.AAC.1